MQRTLEPVEELLHELAAKATTLARELGQPDLAGQIDAGLSRSEAGVANVVVVGEKKRGKSSLLNALLGVRGLLPVDADVATSCYLSVQYGPTARAVAYEADHPEGIDISLSAVGEYASLAGNRDPDDEDQVLHEAVSAVEVFVDDPLLRRGLVLVDTPGVGGLEAGHTEITLATLSRADALVFVVDPDSPLKAPELRFLKRATERIATVLFAMTKIDLYPGWERILADNQALIAQHAPRYLDCPWAPVSSEVRLDAVEADRAGDEARSRDLHQRSGFSELERLLEQEVLGRSHVLQVANVLQSIASCLDRLAAAEELQIRAAAGDPALVDELEDRQASLRRLTDANAAWKQESSEAFRRLELELQRELQRRLRELRRDTEDRIAAGGPELTTELPSDIPARLQAIWMELTTMLQQGVAGLTLALTREFEAEGIEPVTFDLDFPEALESVPPIGRFKPADTLTDYLPAGLMGFGGSSVAATAGAAVGIALSPLLIVGAGVGLAYFIFGKQATKGELQRTTRELNRWLTRMIEDAAQELSGQLREAFARVPGDTEEYFLGRLKLHRTQLENEIAECKQRVRADQTERARVRADAEGRLRRINDVAQTAAELFALIESKDPRRRSGDAKSDTDAERMEIA